VASSKGYDDFEMLQRTKQGQIRHVHVTAQPLEIAGSSAHHCIWRDITERKRLETKLQQVQKMDALGALSGGIAHEFSNLLDIIIGNTELALDDGPEWNPIRDYLQEIRTASLRGPGMLFGTSWLFP
jgi:two-component system cell cycle sensor histidine kinase/response regulator CckA